jgi:MFS transporter, ACS family, pantothenate transporter
VFEARQQSINMPLAESPYPEMGHCSKHYINVLPSSSRSSDDVGSPASSSPSSRSAELPASPLGAFSFLRYVWDDPAKPKHEKWFLFKLDVFLLSAACLGYFSKNLDQANINNAYVSGMKEALQMNGSQLTYAGNCFTAGYILGQVPAVILVTRVRPSILVPTCEILWSVCTFCTATITSTSHLYALRFLVALFESVYVSIQCSNFQRSDTDNAGSSPS